jgi:hypothetical protein
MKEELEKGEECGYVSWTEAQIYYVFIRDL